MPNLRDKINSRMDALEEQMNKNVHLKDANLVSEMIYSVSKFWSALSEEDREYVQAARWALEEKRTWKDD